MKFLIRSQLLACLCLLAVLSNAKAVSPQEYHSRDFSFSYSDDFRVVEKGHGAVVQITPPSRSPHWQDTITIQKHNRRTEECDLPNDTRLDARDHRKIAGRRAFAYSGEDAAMNRTTKTKGYIIETRTACWRFELVRKSRPFHKFDLPGNELKRLEQQSARDARTADAAFRMILDTFALRSGGR